MGNDFSKTVYDECWGIVKGSKPVIPQGWERWDPGLRNRSENVPRQAPQQEDLSAHPYLKTMHYKGGGHAILMAFHCQQRKHGDDAGRGPLSGPLLRRLAQQWCKEPMEANFFQGRLHAAWDSHKVLVRHKFIHKQSMQGARAQNGFGRGGPCDEFTLTDLGQRFIKEVLKRYPVTEEDITARSGDGRGAHQQFSASASPFSAQRSSFGSHRSHYSAQRPSFSAQRPAFSNRRAIDSGSDDSGEDDDEDDLAPPRSGGRSAPASSGRAGKLQQKDIQEFEDWLEVAIPGEKKKFRVSQKRRQNLHKFIESLPDHDFFKQSYGYGRQRYLLINFLGSKTQGGSTGPALSRKRGPEGYNSLDGESSHSFQTSRPAPAQFVSGGQKRQRVATLGSLTDQSMDYDLLGNSAHLGQARSGTHLDPRASQYPAPARESYTGEGHRLGGEKIKKSKQAAHSAAAMAAQRRAQDIDRTSASSEHDEDVSALGNQVSQSSCSPVARRNLWQDLAQHNIEVNRDEDPEILQAMWNSMNEGPPRKLSANQSELQSEYSCELSRPVDSAQGASAGVKARNMTEDHSAAQQGCEHVEKRKERLSRELAKYKVDLNGDEDPEVLQAMLNSMKEDVLGRAPVADRNDQQAASPCRKNRPLASAQHPQANNRTRIMHTDVEIVIDDDEPTTQNETSKCTPWRPGAATNAGEVLPVARGKGQESSDETVDLVEDSDVEPAESQDVCELDDMSQAEQVANDRNSEPRHEHMQSNASQEVIELLDESQPAFDQDLDRQQDKLSELDEMRSSSQRDGSDQDDKVVTLWFDIQERRKNKDWRELQSKTRRHLADLDGGKLCPESPLSEGKLPLADYWWSQIDGEQMRYSVNAIIERKTISDLVSRSFAGDHMKQLWRMRKCGPSNGFLLVEGKIAHADKPVLFGLPKDYPAHGLAAGSSVIGLDRDVRQLFAWLMLSDRTMSAEVSRRNQGGRVRILRTEDEEMTCRTLSWMSYILSLVKTDLATRKSLGPDNIVWRPEDFTAVSKEATAYGVPNWLMDKFKDEEDDEELYERNEEPQVFFKCTAAMQEKLEKAAGVEILPCESTEHTEDWVEISYIEASSKLQSAVCRVMVLSGCQIVEALVDSGLGQGDGASDLAVVSRAVLDLNRQLIGFHRATQEVTTVLLIQNPSLEIQRTERAQGTAKKAVQRLRGRYEMAVLMLQLPLKWWFSDEEISDLGDGLNRGFVMKTDGDDDSVFQILELLHVALALSTQEQLLK